MGTRNLICVFYRGRFVIAQYCQWDGYPEGQGVRILNFLLNSANIDRLKNGLQFIVTLDQEDLEQFLPSSLPHTHGNCKCGKGEAEPFPPSLSRDSGARILEIIAQATAEKRVPIMLDLEFANDGLFCEWAYVVDLDNNVFEVFGGAVSKDKAGSDHRFASVGGERVTVPALVKSFPFAELPATEEEFVKILQDVIGDEEEEE
ncbi:hypothetical protein VTN77DRAFT_5585 [Rasamsonia byssochlamydoides]|uniref:uncharacterized protein n=1 Tax=Rasamsonia byssochlamydoides TaxID=89139 RepID=UPI0037442B82